MSSESSSASLPANFRRKKLLDARRRRSTSITVSAQSASATALPLGGSCSTASGIELVPKVVDLDLALLDQGDYGIVVRISLDRLPGSAQSIARLGEAVRKQRQRSIRRVKRE